MSLEQVQPAKLNAFTALPQRLEQIKNKPDISIKLKKGEFLNKAGVSYTAPKYVSIIAPFVEDKDLAFAQTLKKMKRSI